MIVVEVQDSGRFKTMLANRVYAMSVIAALTAQNTIGVDTIYDVDASFVASQMDSVFTVFIQWLLKLEWFLQKEVFVSYLLLVES